MALLDGDPVVRSLHNLRKFVSVPQKSYINESEWLTLSAVKKIRHLKKTTVTRILVLTYTSFHGTATTSIQELFQICN